MSATSDHGDSAELEALFDSIVTETTRKETPASRAPQPAPASASNAPPLISEIGQLTRALHDSLRDVGQGNPIANSDAALVDATDRLKYIAKMTEQAAERTLTAAETAKPYQDKLEKDAAALAQQWDKLFANNLSVEEFKSLAVTTRDFLVNVPAQTRATNAQLTDIVMAQDFQDLTGQVINKMMQMTHEVEGRLVKMLVDNAPAPQKEKLQASGLGGPVVNAAKAVDAFTNQKQVDELLESLGF